MKYVSISILTTGPSPIKNDILEFGVIVENTKNQLSYDDSPKFRFWVDKEFYRGHPGTLAAHSDILQKICKLREKFSKRLIVPDDVTMNITKFLQPHFSEAAKFKKPIVVAGVHFADHAKMFLDRFPNFKNIPINTNILDPSNFLIDWSKDDRPPTFQECKKRCNLPIKLEGLNTLELAWDVILMLRSKYNKKKPLIEATYYVPPIKDLKGGQIPETSNKCKC